jgi:hypothetical protein
MQYTKMTEPGKFGLGAWSSRKFANTPIGQSFAEHTAIFDPKLSDSIPSGSIAIARVDHR